MAELMLVDEFGINKISDIVGDIKNPHKLMKRGVIFGHRDFNEINNIINQNKDFAVVSGMMPSGQMHIGHKMVVDQLKWYQDLGAMLSLPIADLEAYAARGISFEKGREIAVNEYLTNWIALGLYCKIWLLNHQIKLISISLEQFMVLTSQRILLIFKLL